MMLMDRFVSVCDEPMAELMNLRQQGCVIEYHEAFDVFVSRLELSEEYTLSCFLGGLKKDVQMMVRMFQPDSMRRAFSLAKMYEALSSQSKPAAWFPKLVKSIANSNGILPTPLSAPVVSSSVNSYNRHPYKTLTPERQSKGLCYFCDKAYTPGHSAVHKKLQIHVLEIDDPVEEEEPTEEESTQDPPNLGEPQISVRALTGVPNFRTMRVTGF